MKNFIIAIILLAFMLTMLAADVIYQDKAFSDVSEALDEFESGNADAAEPLKIWSKYRDIFSLTVQYSELAVLSQALTELSLCAPGSEESLTALRKSREALHELMHGQQLTLMAIF